MRTELLENREHLVIHTVMLTVGVHEGSNGPILYVADELRVTANYWNSRPIVVYHPNLMTGNGFAGNPVVFNQQKIGFVFNAQFDGQNLTCDCWIDIERAKKVDGRVMLSIQQNKAIEVSTGLLMEFEQSSGVWNGRKYVAVGRNYRPDHLAILPDEVGACSISAGCGMLRNQKSVSILIDEVEGLPLPMMF